MGKIRVKSFDESSPEEEAKLKAKKEAKRAEKMAAKNASKVTVVDETETVTTPEETVETQEDVKTPEDTVVTVNETVSDTSVREATNDNEAIKEDKPKKEKKEKFAAAAKKVDSKRHKENLTHVSKSSTYKLDQALDALRKFKKSKFDESVELHINTKEKGVSGQVVLPHGTGKTLQIKIADEAILAEVAKGKINFDILVATPQMMPQLARVAKILGPRGLMPNPKNGTITDNPEDAVKKLSGGQVSYKTESQAPIIHAIVGKVSFEDQKIKENVTTFISAVGKDKIASVTLKSTMSPAIRLQV